MAFIRATMAAQPSLSRTELAAVLCEAWGWRRPNGALRRYACRDLLLRLEEWGHLQLPPRRKAAASRKGLARLPPDLVPLCWVEVRDPVSLESLVVRPVQPEERAGWRLFMERYHYLGYRGMVGEHLLYAALLDGDLVALLGWAAAALHAPWRERFIGWDEATKRRRLHLVTNNVRFLVPPWVQVKNLASKVLAANLRRLSFDWQVAWGHPVYLAESFVDTARFRGTCYQAANWRYLGQTAGRTKRGNAMLNEGSPKALYVYPLHRRACQILRAEAAP